MLFFSQFLARRYSNNQRKIEKLVTVCWQDLQINKVSTPPPKSPPSLPVGNIFTLYPLTGAVELTDKKFIAIK